MINEYNGAEVWYNIPQYAYNLKPYYQISNYDRILNKETGYILKHRFDEKGYVIYSLRGANGNSINVYLHRLKMLMFNYIEGCEELTVDHKDCNKLNNRLSNLEWVTHGENTLRAIYNGIHPVGEDYYNSILTNDEVEIICLKLSQGVPISDIVNYIEGIIHPRQSPNIKSIIYSILHRESWKSISQRYEFANYSNETFTRDQVIYICELLQQGKSYDNIIKTLGYNDLDQYTLNRLRNVLSNIKCGVSYKDITKNYIFPVEEQKLISDENVHKICQLIATTDLSNTQILHSVIGMIEDKNMHIKLRRSINEIRKKITHKAISDQYF